MEEIKDRAEEKAAREANWEANYREAMEAGFTDADIDQSTGSPTEEALERYRSENKQPENQQTGPGGEAE